MTYGYRNRSHGLHGDRSRGYGGLRLHFVNVFGRLRLRLNMLLRDRPRVGRSFRILLREFVTVLRQALRLRLADRGVLQWRYPRYVRRNRNGGSDFFASGRDRGHALLDGDDRSAFGIFGRAFLRRACNHANEQQRQ